MGFWPSAPPIILLNASPAFAPSADPFNTSSLTFWVEFIISLKSGNLIPSNLDKSIFLVNSFGLLNISGTELKKLIKSNSPLSNNLE